MAREAKTFDTKILALEAEEITTGKQALALLAKMGQEMTADEAQIRMARRALALYKDQARKAAGKAAEHKYTPDLSRVEDARAVRDAATFLVEVADTYKEFAAELAPVKKARKVAAPVVEEKAAPVKKARKAEKAA